MADNGKRVKPSRVQVSVLVALRNGGTLTQSHISGIRALTKSIHHAAWIGSLTLDAIVKRGWVAEEEPRLDYDAYYKRYQVRRFVITDAGRAAVEDISL